MAESAFKLIFIYLEFACKPVLGGITYYEHDVAAPHIHMGQKVWSYGLSLTGAQELGGQLKAPLTFHLKRNIFDLVLKK